MLINFTKRRFSASFAIISLMEELVDNIRSKSTFHEIKNQISVCDLYLEIIKKILVKENVKNDGVDRAIKAIYNSLKAIELSMLELKAQTNPVSIKSFKLSPLVNDVFLACVSYINGKDIEFKNSVDFDLEISADKDKMYSVLINLCKNAVEAIDKRGLIEIYNDTESIYIKNDGNKIPEDIRNSIFNDGFTTKQEGSGLGLMLVKKLLEVQSSDIELLLSDDEETIFKISVNIC